MSKKVILLIDDESIILHSLVDQLQHLLPEYFYEIAETADEGFEIIDELVADNLDLLVIISDWLMPGMKGDEFLVQVHQKYPKIIKIMLTGQANQEAVERAKVYANLHSCLQKPWSETVLVETIQRALGEMP